MRYLWYHGTTPRQHDFKIQVRIDTLISNHNWLVFLPFLRLKHVDIPAWRHYNWRSQNSSLCRLKCCLAKGWWNETIHVFHNKARNFHLNLLCIWVFYPYVAHFFATSIITIPKKNPFSAASLRFEDLEWTWYKVANVDLTHCACIILWHSISSPGLLRTPSLGVKRHRGTHVNFSWNHGWNWQPMMENRESIRSFPVHPFLISLLLNWIHSCVTVTTNKIFDLVSHITRIFHPVYFRAMALSALNSGVVSNERLLRAPKQMLESIKKNPFHNEKKTIVVAVCGELCL